MKIENPERGRKLTSTNNTWLVCIFEDREPREGTETQYRLIQYRLCSHLKIENPERGRKRVSQSYVSRLLRQFEDREPREGTETQYCFRHIPSPPSIFEDREPREGTETIDCLVNILLI